MKTEEEIEYAHKLIDLYLDSENQAKPPEPQVLEIWLAAKSVVCWFLGHEFGKHFQVNLEKLEKQLKDKGFNIVRMPTDDEIGGNGHGDMSPKF